MAKRIIYCIPVDVMSGSLSGRQLLEYGPNMGKAYDIPSGTIEGAENYQPRMIAMWSSRLQLRYFQVRTKHSVNMTNAMRLNMALMGGVGAIYAAIISDKTSQLYIDCVQACPKDMTLRSFLAPLLRQGLAAKNSTLVIADGVAINNPWISGGTGSPVTIAQSVLSKFDSVLGFGKISPYSDAATLILKNTFPQQWAIIRDYGIANPDIVPYMNAYATEDPKIAMSLVPGIGTRCLVASNGAYVDTGHIFDQNEGERRVKFRCDAIGPNYRYWGSYQVNIGRSMMCYPISNRITLGIGDGLNPDYNTGVAVTVGSWYEIYMKADNGTATFKVYVDGVLAAEGTYPYSKSIVVPATEPIFCDKEAGTVMYKTPMTIELFETKEEGVHTQLIYPFLRNNQAGFINLVDGQFMGNAASSGTLTIVEIPT